MKRAAEERTLAERRARRRALWFGQAREPGRYRKVRPTGCLKAQCGLCHPDRWEKPPRPSQAALRYIAQTEG